LISRSFMVSRAKWYHSAMLSDAVPARSPSRITSRHNPLVTRYRLAARGEATDQMLLDGPHLLADALAAGLTVTHAVVASTAADRPDVRALTTSLERKGTEVALLAPQVMAAVSPVRSSSAIVALANRPAANGGRLFARASPLVVIANDIQDPGNLGAIVRAAEAGQATSVIAAGACADPFGWKALRGSSGSALRLPVGTAADAASAVADARRHGCRIVATVPRGGRSLYDTDLRGAAAILIGGEGPGLDPDLIAQADTTLTIPMRAPVESLNAAVAAAVIVYEALRQRS
jgi:RNA methyltransferase, TrmH family